MSDEHEPRVTEQLEIKIGIKATIERYNDGESLIEVYVMVGDDFREVKFSEMLDLLSLAQDELGMIHAAAARAARDEQRLENLLTDVDLDE